MRLAGDRNEDGAPAGAGLLRALREVRDVAAQPHSVPRIGRDDRAPEEREREVLVLVGKGMKGAEIGLLLGMSLWTVRDHEKHIYRKLGVSGRVEAAVWASKAGLL
jgi:DNA-binding CsgD family transcriptional regulator